MDFINDADGRYTLSGTVYNDLSSFLTAAGGSFSRASVGTYFDSSGTLQTATSGQPRFDYDPVTHAAKGILMEESRTNFLRNTQSISLSAPWYNDGTTASIQTNDALAPDGTMTASKLTRGAGSAFIHQVLSDNSASVYTGSIYAKAGTGTAIRLTLQEFGSDFTAYGNATVLTLDNTWQRISVTGTKTADGNNIRLVLNMSSNLSGEYIYIWGAQLEKAGFASSYIPTTASTVTREEDIITIPVGAWYNQSAGSFLNDISWESVSGADYPTFFRVDDSTDNNLWNLMYNQGSNTIETNALVATVQQGLFSNAASTSGSMSVAGAQSVNSANVAFDGTLDTLDTSWTPPSVSQLILDGSTGAKKWHSMLKYYPLRASDAQLQLMTQ